MRGLECTVVNTAVVVLAAVAGLLLRKKLSEEHKNAVVLALGLSAIPIGVTLFLETRNPLIPLISVTLGFLWGCLWRLQDKLDLVGDWLRKHTKLLVRLVPNRKEGDDFTSAFVTATVVSLVGPLALMGPIKAGLEGDCSLIYTKCVFDLFATVIFASSLGEGVLFSAIPIFGFQAALTIAASWMEPLMTEAVIAELTSTGGILIMAMGINVSEIRKIKMGDMLPAIFLAPLVSWLLGLVMPT